MIFGVLGHLFDVVRQIDEGLVLHAGAGRAADDVHAVLLETGHGAETARGDVREDGAADRNLLAFAFEGEGQRDADGVADPLGDELLEGDPGLDDPIRRHPRLGHAEVQRHLRAGRSKPKIRIDDFVRIGVLDGDAVLVEPEIVEHDAMLHGRLDHGRDVVVFRVTIELFRVHRTGVHADAHGAPMLPRDIDQIADLFPNRLLPLQMVEVARVVPELLHERGDLLGETVVLLQVDHQVGLRPGGADLGKGDHVLRVVDGDADDVCSCLFQKLDLADGGIDVLGPGCGHRLHGNRVGSADADIANADLAGGSRFHAVLQTIGPGKDSGDFPVHW